MNNAAKFSQPSLIIFTKGADIFLSMRACVFVCVSVCVCVRACVRVCVFMNIYVCVCVSGQFYNISNKTSIHLYACMNDSNQIIYHIKLC